MKYRHFFLLPLLLSGLLSAQSLDEKIMQTIKLSGVEAQFSLVINNMIDMQQNNPALEGLSPNFWEEFRSEVQSEGMSSLYPDIVRIYREHYTEEEIDHLLAYLRSPLTKTMIAKQGAVTTESMAAGRAWGEAMGAKIAERIAERQEQPNVPSDSLGHKH